MNGLLDNPAIIGLIVAIPSFTLGYLGYRRSVKVDKAAEKSGEASASTAAVGQVIQGLNSLIDSLQEDNALLRESVAGLSIRLKQVTDEHEQLKRQVMSLKKKYAVID